MQGAVTVRMQQSSSTGSDCRCFSALALGYIFSTAWFISVAPLQTQRKCTFISGSRVDLSGFVSFRFAVSVPCFIACPQSPAWPWLPLECLVYTYHRLSCSFRTSYKFLTNNSSALMSIRARFVWWYSICFSNSILLFACLYSTLNISPFPSKHHKNFIWKQIK